MAFPHAESDYANAKGRCCCHEFLSSRQFQGLEHLVDRINDARARGIRILQHGQARHFLIDIHANLVAQGLVQARTKAFTFLCVQGCPFGALGQARQNSIGKTSIIRIGDCAARPADRPIAAGSRLQGAGPVLKSSWGVRS